MRDSRSYGGITGFGVGLGVGGQNVVGDTVGLCDCGVGRGVGALRSKVGLAEGGLVGGNVGAPVGTGTGAPVGSLVGSDGGTDVGVEGGTGVGMDVGTGVGSGVGGAAWRIYTKRAS